MKRLFLSLLVLTSLVAVAFVTSCAEDDTDSVSFSSFSASLAEISKLYVGETTQIEVVTDPSVTIEDYVKFSVSPISPNKTCAVVDELGVVTGVSAGEAIIAVSSKNGEWMELLPLSVVDVVYPVSSITINGSYDENADGEREMTVFTNAASSAASLFTVTISPTEATTTTVEWSCEDPDNNGSTITVGGDFTPGTGIGKVNIIATLFDSYAFYDDDHTDEELQDADLVASYTYTDKLVVDFVEAYLTFTDSAIAQAASLELSTEPFVLEYLMKVPYTDPEVVWSSSNMAVASVDASTGLVTVVGAGRAIITAACNDVSDTVEVTVNYVEITDLSINDQSQVVDSGDSRQFTVAVNQNASPAVIWSVDPSDSTGSSISSTGLFTAGNYKGEVTIYAQSVEDNSLVAQSTVTVNLPVNSISLPSNISAVANSTIDLSDLVVFNPTDPSNDEVLWSSASSTISVADGVVTIPASATTGITAVITAKSSDNSNATANCTITVVGSVVDVTSVTITGSTAMTITNTSATTTLTADSDVFWSSSDSRIATVDAVSGVVTAIAEGTVTIKATSITNPSVSQIHTIAVSPTRVTSFTLSAISVVVGKSATVVPVIAPSTATYQGYTMEVSSGAESILFDAATGVVIGNAIGSATITVTPEDTTMSAVTCTVTISSGAGIGNLEEGDGSFVIQ